MKFLVIEVCNREINSVIPCATKDNGIEIANDLLLKQMSDDVDGIKVFETGDDEGVSWQRASSSNLNAWCNLYSQEWDCFIWEVREP